MISRHLTVVSVAALFAAIGASAYGQEFSSPYIEFGGGPSTFAPTLTNFDPHSTGNIPSVTFTPGIGGEFHAALGAQVLDALRGEVLATGTLGSGRFNVSGEGNGVINVNAQSMALLAAFWKDFDLTEGFGMHIGGGLGVGVVTMTTDNPAQTATGVGPAYMFGVGVDHPLGTGAVLSFDLRAQGVLANLGTLSGITTDDPDDSGTANLGVGPSVALTVGLRLPLG